MSIACGIHVGRVVALAADTRLMMNIEGRLVKVSDDDTKIHFWGNGFITGVGHSATIRDAALRLASVELRTTDDVSAALSAGWHESLRIASKSNPEISVLMAATALYLTVGMPDGPLPGIFAPGQVGDGFRVVPSRSVFGSPPADLDPASWAGIRDPPPGIPGCPSGVKS